MKYIILSFCIVLSISLSAQTFELVAPRAYNPSNWDFPKSENLYFDSGGTLFNYISESSQPRSNELLRYDAVNDIWIDLTNNSFMVPGGSGVTGGVPMPDGSIITITDSFGPTNPHLAYTVLPNGTAVPFPSHPLPTGTETGINICPVQAPNGDIYYSHNIIDIDVGKWDGTQWTELPEVTSGTLGGGSGMGVDNNGDVYVVHTDNTTNDRARFVKFDASTNSWNQLFLSSETGVDVCKIYTVSSTEIYIYYADGAQMFVTLFDGTNFTSLGNGVPAQQAFARPGAMLKSQATGDLYLAAYTTTGNGFYRYNQGTNNWDVIPNDIADGGLIVSYHPTLAEKDGCIYISSNEAIDGLTTVRYCPAIACAPMDLSFNFDNTPQQTSWQILDASGTPVASGGGYNSGDNSADESVCLSDGCYELVVSDSANNGMCPFRAVASSSGTFITPGTVISPGTLVATLGTVVTPGLCGNYNLQDANGNVIANGGGSFGNSETNSFCISGGVPQLFANDDADYNRKVSSSTETNTFRLYPNPTNDILNIQFEGKTVSETQLNIVDMTGKIIYTETRAIFNSTIQLNVNDMNSGIYFIQIIDNEQIMTEKFVVE